MATKPATVKAVPAKSVAGKAKAKAVPAEAAPAEASDAKQGRAIVLPNGERRVDYIKRRFAEGIKRGDIMREVNQMLEDAGRSDERIAYQIVFAATKAAKASAGADAADGEDEDEDEDEEE